MTERSAIYFAPAATSNLWDRAATWLGRDASDGTPFDGPVAGIDRDRLLNLTQSANRYGFHATIKAPMVLADGATEADLRAALAEFVTHHQPIDLGRLRLAALQGFLALMVDGENEAPQDFAAHVVEDFDPFRALMSVKDRAARAGERAPVDASGLSDAFSYPYVRVESRFLTALADCLGEADARHAAAAAATWFGPVLDQPVLLDRLLLFHESDAGKPLR